jgi:hypothetical protein
VRTHFVWASATLALVLSAVTACGSSSAAGSANPTASCVNAGAPHHAYVVVEHLSGSSVQKCVGFNSDTIDASALMDSSGIEYQTQTFSFGKAICQIDNEPKQYAECLPQNAPYWALFLETSSAWAVAQTGYTQVALRDKEALGWHYVQPTDPSPAPPPLPTQS